MRRWPFVALLAIPLLDVVLLVYVSIAFLGAVATVALVVLTALIGMMLVRAEGRHTLGNIQRKFAAGELPTDDLLDGGLLVAAGAFLLTPGLVTDFIGLLFVLPPTRYPIRLALKRWVIVPAVEDRTGGFVSGDVYTFRFPGESGVGFVGGPGGWPGGGGGQPGSGGDGGFGDDEYDLGPDAYHVDIEADAEDEDPGNGNA
jgi:UPF0716 protein FxsA